ncbi:MAG TPA: hypothetical protein VF172_02920, partial [Nitrososphaera sp.]
SPLLGLVVRIEPENGIDEILSALATGPSPSRAPEGRNCTVVGGGRSALTKLTELLVSMHTTIIGDNTRTVITDLVLVSCIARFFSEVTIYVMANFGFTIPKKPY